MENTYQNNSLAMKMVLALKKNSKNCKSIDDYLDLAYQFEIDKYSIKPFQIRNEIHGLLKILEKEKPDLMLEVGTANGGTLFLLSKIASDNATILSIDLPNGSFGGDYYPDWKIPLYKSFATKKQNIHLIRKDSHDVNTVNQIKKLLGNKKLDFLLIDGDHTYEGVKRDFELYSPLVAACGIIAFHDINPGPKDLVGGVPEFWKEISPMYTYLEIVDNDNSDSYGIGLLFYKLNNKISTRYTEALKVVNKLKENHHNVKFELSQGG